MIGCMRLMSLPTTVAKTTLNGISFHLHSKLGIGTKPTFLLFRVTERCNGRCRMCKVWSKPNPREMESHIVDTILRSNRAFLDRINWVSLTGGEPFCHDDLDGVVRSIAEHCVSLRSISIPTNGMHGSATEMKVRSILSELPADVCLTINVSIDHIEASENDKLRGQGALRNALHTISSLSHIDDERLLVGCLTLISPANVGNLHAIYHSLRTYVPYVSFSLVASSDFFCNEDTTLFGGLTKEERMLASQFLEWLSHRHPRYSYVNSNMSEILISGRRKFPCVAGYKSLFMDADGTILPCHLLPREFAIGNAKTDAIRKIWLSSRGDVVRRTLRSLPECRRCVNLCDSINIGTQEFFHFACHTIATRNFANIMRDLMALPSVRDLV